MLPGLRILPLGGLGEVGMNCMALVDGDQALVVDCGVTFDDRGLGVDVAHPDFRALLPYQVVGVVLTHGHEDHIGALPYFLRRFDVPIWGPRYALALLDRKADEHEVLDLAKLRETTPRQAFSVGRFRVEPIRVTHSIADATALSIETPWGRVLHTGDFKLDPRPDDGEAFDEERLRELARDGIGVLLSDSTNAEIEGSSGSEADVFEPLLHLVDTTPGVCVVSLFASNVHRLRMLGRIAQATKRRIVPLGRGIMTHLDAARASGYVDWPRELVLPADRARQHASRELLCLATGSQGEERAALARLARRAHPAIVLGEGDRVILSSRVIPGRQPAVFAIVGDLLRQGVDVRWTPTDPRVHVSGHACRDEQRRMIEICEPRAFVPIHGAFHQLTAHARLARDAGVREVAILEDGQTGVFDGQAIARGDDFSCPRVHAWEGQEVAEGVIGERKALARDGVVFVTLDVDRDGRAAGEAELATRGVVPEHMQTTLAAAVRREIATAVTDMPPPHTREAVAEVVRRAARRAVHDLAGRKPVTTVLLRAPR